MAITNSFINPAPMFCAAKLEIPLPMVVNAAMARFCSLIPAAKPAVTPTPQSLIELYTIFCDMGMYDWDLLLDTYNTIGHPFSPHPNRKHVRGITHANRNKGIKSKLFCMLGDGEMEEGSNWDMD